MDNLTEVFVVRDMQTAGPAGTFGVLTAPNFKSVTCERPPVGDHPFMPTGRYYCELAVSPHFYASTLSHPAGHNFGFGRGIVYHVRNVPGRDLILIHPANWPFQLEGCLALGAQVAMMETPAGEMAKGVTSSDPAVHAFMASMGGAPFWLIVK